MGLNELQRLHIQTLIYFASHWLATEHKNNCFEEKTTRTIHSKFVVCISLPVPVLVFQKRLSFFIFLCHMTLRVWTEQFQMNESIDWTIWNDAMCSRKASNRRPDPYHKFKSMLQSNMINQSGEKGRIHHSKPININTY